MGELPVLMEYVIPNGFTRQDYWNSLGLGILKDVIDINVTEDLEGVFQLEMQYPEDGKLAKEIKVGRVIKVRTRQDMTAWEEQNYKEPGNNGLWDGAFYHRLGWEYQPFYINDIEYDVSGVFIIRGVHYTYRIGELYYSMIRSDKIPKDDNPIFYGMKRPFQILGEAWSSFSVVDSYYNNVYTAPAFKDHNGANATKDVTKGSVTLGATTLYQDIKQYSELDPWNDRRPDNWTSKTFELEQRNFADKFLGDDEKSFRKVYNFEVLRDRWGIVMTDRRTMKTWDDAYEIRYGKDMKNIKVDIDMSDILPAVFPYFIVEDDYTYRTEEITKETITHPNGSIETVDVSKMVDKTVTCRMEVNFRGTTFPFPAHSSGNYILVPQSKWPNYMFKGIRKDITEYVDIEAIKQMVKVDRIAANGGSYSIGGFNKAQLELEKNAPEYLRRANIQFGEATADIDFLPLWDTLEAKHKPALQKLRLGDPVVIIHEPLQLKIYSRVSETNYDSLTDQYKSIKIKSYSVVPL